MTFHTREQIEAMYSQFLTKTIPTDVCWTFHERAQQIAMLGMKDLDEQVRLWIKSKDSIIDKENNRKVTDDDGRVWHSLVLQVVDKKTGGFDEERNPMGSFGLLKFGELCSGYTYYFKDEAMRDAVVDCVKNKRPLEDKIIPMCPLCRRHPLGAYDGHNAYPIMSHGGRCCEKCNAGLVIPARIEGVVRCEDTDAEELFCDVSEQLGVEIGSYVNEYFEMNGTRPISTELKHPLYATFRMTFRCELIEMNNTHFARYEEYLKQRIQRHLTIRSVTSPREIIMTILGQIKNDMFEDIEAIRVRWASVLEAYDKMMEEEQKKKERECAEAFAKEEKQKQEAKRTKKADTRDANKARDAKKREREEFERRVAEAERARLAQEAKDRQRKAQKKAQKK
jgi:hypothetical protein